MIKKPKPSTFLKFIKSSTFCNKKNSNNTQPSTFQKSASQPSKKKMRRAWTPRRFSRLATRGILFSFNLFLRWIPFSFLVILFLFQFVLFSFFLYLFSFSSVLTFYIHFLFFLFLFQFVLFSFLLFPLFLRWVWVPLFLFWFSFSFIICTLFILSFLFALFFFLTTFFCTCFFCFFYFFFIFQYNLKNE